MRRVRREKPPQKVLEARKKKSATQALEKGFCVIRRSRRGIRGYYNKDGQVIMFRSALELAFFREFQEDSSIESWEYEPERIPYTYRGKAHKTVVDVIVRYTDRRTEYIEIKPSSKIHDKLVEAKAAAILLWISSKPNTTFRFLTELELGNRYEETLQDCRKVNDTLYPASKKRRRTRSKTSRV